MGFLKKLFLSENDKQLKKLSATADKVLELVQKYQNKSNIQLRECTVEFKARVQKGESLDSILPDAYAVAVVAIKRVLGFDLFKVQVMGAICLHQGAIAEMLTGEGKTVVATLPAYLNALSGKGVHVVTVNEYLAERDANWMGGIYRFLGLSVGIIKAFQSGDEKRAAYACDITYGTNSEFGFDYLRDNMQKSTDKTCQRGLNYAIVDEVDSILIDEARTPLIIAGQVTVSDEQYTKADKFAKTLTPSTYIPTEEERQNYLEADGDFAVDEEKNTISLTTTGIEKAEKFFKVKNIVEDIDLYKHIRFAIKANFLMKRDKDYVVIDGEVIIVDEFTGRLMVGRRYNEGLHQAIEAKEGVKIQGESKTFASVTFQNFFRLYSKLCGMTGTAKLEEQEFVEIYGVNVVCIPPNRDVQRIDEADRVYPSQTAKLNAIVEDIAACYKKGQPVLVGTPSVEKSEELSALLNQANVPHLLLNAKNHREEAMIIAQAGRKGSITVATNMAGRGTDIILGGNASFYAVKVLEDKGVDPVQLDKMLHTAETEFTSEMASLKKQYDAQYAQIQKELAGEREQVINLGGLRVIGTEKNENRRIDNQLRGRSGRQGDVGSSVYYLSFEDDLLRIAYGDELSEYAESNDYNQDSLIQNKYIENKIKEAQKDIEQRNYSIRKNVLSYDDVLNKQRLSIYRDRTQIMNSPSVHDRILKYIPDFVSEIVQLTVDFRDDYRYWDYDKLNEQLNDKLLPEGTISLTIGLAADMKIDTIIDEVLRLTFEKYENKKQLFNQAGIDFDTIEKDVILSVIDSEWINQMDNMDNLRSCVSLKALGQVNPIINYQIEGMKFFDDMIDEIKRKTVAILLKLDETEIIARLKQMNSYPEELLDD